MKHTLKSKLILIFCLAIFYYFTSFILSFIGMLTLASLWFTLKSKTAVSNREIPFLSIQKDQYTKKLELKYSDKINTLLQDILSLILKDYFAWHGIISKKLYFIENVEFLMIKALDEIVSRFKQIDLVDLVNSKILFVYLDHIKLMSKTRQNLHGDKHRTFTQTKEFDYLFATRYADIGTIHKSVLLSSSTLDPSFFRQVINSVLPCVLPHNEYQSSMCKTLIIEVVVKLIILPVFDLICEPNYINSFIDMFCTHLLREMRMVKELRRALEASSQETPLNNKLKTYDEFLQMISLCQNLLEAKRIRDQIVMEIRRKRLVIGDNHPNQTVNGVKVKKIIQYTNKLVVAKRRVEKRIVKLGGNVPIYEHNMKEPKLLDVMESAVGVSYFSEFLDQQKAQKVLQLYLSLQGLSHQLDTFDIENGNYSSLISDFTNSINIYFSGQIDSICFPITVENALRQVVSQLHAYKIDYITFAKAKSYLFDFIQTFFKSFKSSDLWIRMTSEFALDNKDIPSDNEDLEALDESELLGTDAIQTVQGQLKHIIDVDMYSELTPVSTNPLSSEADSKSETSTQILSITAQLQELNDQIDKLKQHEAILSSLVKSHATTQQQSLSHSKSTFVLKALGSEDESFKILRKSFQDVQTELKDLNFKKLQLENQGRDLSLKPGQIDIYIDSYTHSFDGKKEFILYLIRVQIQEGHSWNIYRRYSEFVDLYEQLKQEFPMLPYELPKKRPNMLYVGQLKEELAATRQNGLESYLKNVAHHEDVCSSMSFRRFLSQDKDNTRVVSTPQLIINDESPRKQSKWSTSPIFGAKHDKAMSELIVELFDLQDSTFRKHAVTLVINQVFGGMIDKKMTESIQQLLNEEMLLFYLETLKEKLFSNVQHPIPIENTKIKLELLFPEIFGGFLGRNNAFKAADKVFDSFQNKLLNMHLITSCAIELVKEMFPECFQD